MSTHSQPQESRADLSRRNFLQTTGAAALAASLPTQLVADDKSKSTTPPETRVKSLFDSFSETQKKEICFDWNHKEERRGLLRTRISNNWHITKPNIVSDFYTKDQQQMIREIFEGIINPAWHERYYKQLKDDAGGFGRSQNIAIFGTPSEGKFEFVMTGRHMTIRCDGNSAEHVAFGGPIFYGHAASGFNEKPDHPGNVFWEQAVMANKVYEILDGKQRKQAEISKTPQESQVGFRGAGNDRPGLKVSEMSSDQKEYVQKTLNSLIEPYRQVDRDEVVSCLKKQGGIDECHLAFYTDEDLGKDRIWDNWRLEGPSFVWYFRGVPHVHVWVNVANDAAVKLNA